MDDVITSIVTLLTSALGSTYKKYYYGENKAPEQALFPFVEVIPISTSIENIGTGGLMKSVHSVQINIKETIKANLTANTNKATVEHLQDIVKKMEERETNGTLKSATVLGVLHDNLQLSAKVNINGDWEISYTETEYGDSWIVIGSVKFNASRITP